MPTLDPRIDAYLAKAADFSRPILEKLRKLIHKAVPDVVETIRWSVPSFDHHGPLCNMAAFKAHCGFVFFKGPLIFATEEEAQGYGQFGKITSLKDLPPDEVILAYLKKARAVNESGEKLPAKPKQVRKELVVPDYFLRALRANKKAQKAFEGFSYSHQKEYVEWITEAKREETRAKRIESAIEMLAEGKSKNWKYEKC